MNFKKSIQSFAFAALGAVCLATSSPVAADFDEIAISGGDVARTGQQPGHELVVAPQLNWQSQRVLGDIVSVNSALAVSGNLVIAGGHDGYVVQAMVAETGETAWTFNTWYRLVGSPTIVDDTVFIAAAPLDSTGGQLFALDLSTGKLQWNTPIDGISVADSPLVVNDVVYVAAHHGIAEGELIAVDMSGEQIWSTAVGQISGQAAFADATIFVAATAKVAPTTLGPAMQPALVALDPATGEERWSFPISNAYSVSSATVNDGIVYVAGGNTVYGVDANKGAGVLEINLGDAAAIADPAVVDGAIIIGADDNRLRAFSAVSGALLWAVEGDDLFASTPSVAAGTVYAANRGGTFMLIDLATGEIEWSEEFDSAAAGSPVVADRIFLAINGGVVISFYY